jgi:hypothetical protein
MARSPGADYTLSVKGWLLDVWPEWFYGLQRVIAEMLIALELADRRFGGDGSAPGDRGQ